MKKDLEWLRKNINQDIEKASNKEIDKIYKGIKSILKKYDTDSIIKNLLDGFKRLWLPKRKKCEDILVDILENLDEMDSTIKENLRKELLDLSNIHRGFLENLIALLSSL